MAENAFHFWDLFSVRTFVLYIQQTEFELINVIFVSEIYFHISDKYEPIKYFATDKSESIFCVYVLGAAVPLLLSYDAEKCI